MDSVQAGKLGATNTAIRESLDLCPGFYGQIPRTEIPFR